MNTPEATVPQEQLGLYNKFIVKRTDGSSEPGGRHEHDQHFVLNMTTDKHALPALAAYADSCAEEFPVLATDLQEIIVDKVRANDEYITVAETDVTGIGIVPEFRIAKYAAGRGFDDVPISTVDAEPWISVSFDEAQSIVAIADLNQLTVSQACAIAYQIQNQNENWTGGKVGEGKLFQGLHKGTVSSAQPATYESPDPEERRWHVLANGERIYDFSGNVFCWLVDDLHGDERGLVGPNGLPPDSPLLRLPIAPSTQQGTGWRPTSGFENWSGTALVRGGFWGSESNAGVFGLAGVWPGDRYVSIGFRCTQPGL